MKDINRLLLGVPPPPGKVPGLAEIKPDAPNVLVNRTAEAEAFRAEIHRRYTTPFAFDPRPHGGIND